LQFELHGPGPGGSQGPPSDFAVFLDGQALSYSLLFYGSGYVEYGANIPSDMDGQMEALMFAGDNIVLDNIEFSSMSVPEPSEYALLGLGAGLFGFWRQRKR
jgi:hypothetical protein